MPESPSHARSQLGVHLPCAWVRGATSYGRQGCPCDPAEPWRGCDVSRAVDLCEVCARGTAGGTTRFSWLGCQSCRAVEKALQEALGVRVLPLGRHSIMNGVALRVAQAPASDVAAFAVDFEGLAGSWHRLSEWGHAEARRLAATVDGESADVPLAEWEKRLPASLAASVDAYERFLQMPLPDAVRAPLLGRVGGA